MYRSVRSEWADADDSVAATPGGPTRPAVQRTGPITPAERSTLRGIIAYGTRDGDIWVMNANATGRRRVTRSGRGLARVDEHHTSTACDATTATT